MRQKLGGGVCVAENTPEHEAASKVTAVLGYACLGILSWTLRM